MSSIKVFISLIGIILLNSCAKDNYVVYHDYRTENKLKTRILTERFSDYENTSFFVFKETKEYIKDFKLYANKVSEENEIILSSWNEKGAYSKSSVFNLSRKNNYILFFKNQKLEISNDSLNKYRFILIKDDYVNNKIVIKFCNEFKYFL